MPSHFSSSRVLDVRVRQRMPHPIAAAWHRVGLALTPGARLERLLAVPPALVRLVSLAQLADYRRGPRDDIVERTLPSLARPSEGHWLQLLRGLTRTLAERAEPAPPFVAEAGAWLFGERGRPTDAARALEQFVALRNELRHGAAPVSDVDAETRLESVLAVVREVLASTRWLEGYRLFRVLAQEPTPTPGTFGGQVQLFVGSHELPEPEPAEWRGWLLPDRVYLAGPDGRRFLALHPLVQVLPDERRKRELLFELIAAPKLRRLTLANHGAGEEREVAVAEGGADTFEAWLAASDAGSVVENPGEGGLFAVRDDSELDPAASLLADRYEVRDVLGRGGMAVVYRVWDRILEAEFALKVLNGDLSSDRRFRERFRREAQLMARVRHPHLLGASDFGELPDGRLFLKMPVADGGSLRELRGSPVPAETVRVWATQVLGALAALHDAKVVHRDVKPGNLLLDGRGQVLLADLGIALDRTGERLTQTLEHLGSLEYMAPEQRSRASGAEPVDLFALGVVLHELLTGQLPGGRPGEGVAGELGELIRRVTAVEPAERPTARQALALLEAGADAPRAPSPPAVSQTTPAPRATADQPPAPPQPRREPPRSFASQALPELSGMAPEPPPKTARVWVLAFAAIALAGLGLVVLTRGSGPSESSDAAPAEESADDDASAPAEHTPAANRTGSDGMTLVLVPAAELGFGLSPEELRRHRAACEQLDSSRCLRDGYYHDEQPEVPVAVAAFYIDRDEVTRGQYTACVEAGACPALDAATCDEIGGGWPIGPAGPGDSGASLPQLCVDRDAAARYCSWADRRVPSEAEWELAAAGPEGRVFPWGDDFGPGRAQFDDSRPEGPVAVDALPLGATPLGVRQLAGNAYEWVSDEAAGGGVIRGGSFVSDAASLRTTYRRFLEPSRRVSNVGFRCAMDAE